MTDKLDMEPFWEYALEVLRRTPVMKKQALESAIKERFQKDFTALHKQKIKGKDRTRWENLVDWVHANLTRKGLTITTQSGWLVFCESVGWVQGQGNLIRENDYRVIVNKILNTILD